MTDPYGAPQSEDVYVPQPLKAGSVPRAVLVGVTVDIVLSLVLSLAFGMVVGLVMGVTGQEESLTKALENPFSAIMLGGTVLGLVVSFYAGLVCCRVAGSNASRAIVIMALVMAAFGIWISDGIYSLWMSLVLTGLAWLVYWQSYRYFIKSTRRSQ